MVVVILCCKDSASREENKISSLIFSPEAPPILSKDSASRLCCSAFILSKDSVFAHNLLFYGRKIGFLCKKMAFALVIQKNSLTFAPQMGNSPLKNKKWCLDREAR